MSRIIITLLACLAVAGCALAQNPPGKADTTTDASLQPYSSSSSPNAFRFATAPERRLLDLANQARVEAGLAPLQPDEGLTQAARAHAAAMAAEQQLSHQFSGEPALPQRLASASKLHFDVAGENVAYAGTVEQAADNLMHSPQHRENLLSADFNVAGFAVLQSGPRLYVVQDFAHSLPSISGSEADDAIATQINRLRSATHLAQLQKMDGAVANSTACAMARADSLKTPSPRGRYIMRYTAMQPDNLPSAISKVISDASVNTFAEGTCYAKTATYPDGAYFVALIFY